MKKDEFTRSWIIDKALSIVRTYDPGVLTIRGLHYRLVAEGMTNTSRHYKRVVSAMIQARWDGIISFLTFSDRDRAMSGETEGSETDVDDSIEIGKRQIKAWMTHFSKNRWENQPFYPEVFIEKKALEGVFQPVCDRWNVALGSCKGYPSLTFLNEAANRFIEAEDNNKAPIILYFGDYDPSGEDIPRSIQENLSRMGVDVEVRRILLMEDQVVEMGLPPAPKKPGDSRSASWDGLGQVELDAVDPREIQRFCEEAIEDIFDEDLHRELLETEEIEKTQYQAELKTFVEGFGNDA